MVKYQIAFEHEVWGNYMCLMRFYDEMNNLLYSRNVFYYNLSRISKEYFIKLSPNILLVNEYKQPNISDISIIDFNNLEVYRKKFNDKKDIGFFIDSYSKEKWERVRAEYQKETFVIENIQLPFLRFWSRKIQVGHVPTGTFDKD